MALSPKVQEYISKHHPHAEMTTVLRLLEQRMLKMAYPFSEKKGTHDLVVKALRHIRSAKLAAIFFLVTAILSFYHSPLIGNLIGPILASSLIFWHVHTARQVVDAYIELRNELVSKSD